MMDDPVVILSGRERNQNSLVVKRSTSLLKRESIMSIFPSTQRKLCSNSPRDNQQYIGFSSTFANHISFAVKSRLFGKFSMPNPAADHSGDWSRSEPMDSMRAY